MLQYGYVNNKNVIDKSEFMELLNMKNKTVIEQQAKRYDSFYLYDESCILDSVNALKTNFSRINFLYSIKCNPNVNILRSIFAQGFGADAASAGEVILATEVGLRKDDIYYSAPGKTFKDIENTISKAVLIADSIDEIRRIQSVAKKIKSVVNIGIRINPDFSFDNNYGQSSKFGIDENQAIDFIKSNDCKNIKITGIHVHLRSQELNSEVLAGYYNKMFCLAEKFQSLCGSLDYVNMGSGMGIQYSTKEVPLDIQFLSELVKKELDTFQATYPNTKIMIEVGRYVVGKSGVYVTKVVDRKTSYGKTYLILKNTLNGFIRPSLSSLIMRYTTQEDPFASEPLFTSKNAFQIYTLKRDESPELVTLVGNLCTSTDVIAENIMLPYLECEDNIVITNAGSYAAVLSPMQFSTHEKPSELFLTVRGDVIAE